MAEPAEVARRLAEFIQKVQDNAPNVRARGLPGAPQSPRSPRAPRPKSIYEQCVDKLTNKEHDELVRLLDKMDEAMPSSPGAVPRA